MGCKNITEQRKHRLQAYNIDKINTTPILTDCETLHLFQGFGNPSAEKQKKQLTKNTHYGYTKYRNI